MLRKSIFALIAAAAFGAAVLPSTAALAEGPGWCYWHPYACNVD